MQAHDTIQELIDQIMATRPATTLIKIKNDRQGIRILVKQLGEKRGTHVASLLEARPC